MSLSTVSFSSKTKTVGYEEARDVWLGRRGGHSWHLAVRRISDSGDTAEPFTSRDLGIENELRICPEQRRERQRRGQRCIVLGIILQGSSGPCTWATLQST